MPLKHGFYPGWGEIFDYRDITQFAPSDRLSKRVKYRRGGKRKKVQSKPPPDHLDLVEMFEKKDILPCIFFVFSRKECEGMAVECADMFEMQDDRTLEELDRIADKFLYDPEICKMPSVRDLVHVLDMGVAFHHAGMLPAAVLLYRLPW